MADGASSYHHFGCYIEKSNLNNSNEERLSSDS